MPYYYPFSNADEPSKLLVWDKGRIIPKFDSALWRRDICGHAMKYEDHGDTGSQYGWEIDHIKPASKGGPDDIGNLQPLYWKTNRSKGDTFPWSCSMAD